MASTVHARDLGEFVADTDRRGGVPALPAPGGFEVTFDTPVDQSLDPFSDAYFSQQLALYRELSGRDLDQAVGERTALDVDRHAAACNPYGTGDIAFVAKHLRTVLAGVLLAELPPDAAVLDLGSGWGLTSEVLAYCGARVTSVDINPPFVELVRRRADRLGLAIEATHAGFDDFDDGRGYDLVVFYECLHHAVKPWETLARLAPRVKAGGKILWAGEPVNTYWWRHWGLRLDPVSVYCIRKFGWWEGGWSEDFLGRCFARAGFGLTVHPGVGLDGGLIGLARPAVRPEPTRRADPADDAARRVAALERQIAEMSSSLSWRLAAPVRYAGRAVRALRRRRPA